MTTETKNAPSMNGVLKVHKRGRAKFQFGDDEPVIELDVIEVYDQWVEVLWALRDAEGKLPNDKVNEYGKNRQDFVQAVVNTAYGLIAEKPPIPNVSRAEAEQFIKLVEEAAEELRNFTSPKKDAPSSAPASTAPAEEIRFSQ